MCKNLILSHSLRFYTNESLSPPIPILPYLFWIHFITYITNSYLWGFTCSILFIDDTTPPLIMQKKKITLSFCQASAYITTIPNWIAWRNLELTFKVLDQLGYFSPNPIRIIISTIFFNPSDYHADSLFHTVCLPKIILLLLAYSLLFWILNNVQKYSSNAINSSNPPLCKVSKPLNNSPPVRTGNLLKVRITSSQLGP